MTEHDPRPGAGPAVPPARTPSPEPAMAPGSPTASPTSAPPPGPDSPDAPTVRWTPPPPATGQTEPAPPPAAAEPVRRRSGSRARWGIALLLTALIAAVGIGAFILVSGQRVSSAVAGYVPDQAVAYGELRLDLPGDQRQQLGDFLSKFPGFRDQSTLDAKLDDVLDRLIRAMTSDRQDWTTKIEPWFGGQLGVSVGSLPSTVSTEDAAMRDVHWLLTATVKDATAAHAWLEGAIADAGGLPLETETHNGVEIHLDSSNAMATAVAYPDGKVMLVGDDETVRAAIDTGGNGPFAGSDQFKAAASSLEGDHLAYFYLDTAQYLEWANRLGQQLGGGAMPGMGLTESLTPDWMVFQLQARGDALALETVSPRLEISPEANRAGVLAQHVPPSTLFMSDAHDYGATILQVIALLRAEPELTEVMSQVDQYMGFLGGADGLFGWMGDAGIAVARDGDGIHGGLVFSVTDRAKAERLLTTLNSFVSLGGSSAGITLRTEDHNGTEISIVDAGEFSDLLAQSGTPLPPGLTLPEGRAEVAWAVTDQVLVIGVGSSFVRAVLDAGAGDSLADDPRYQAQVARTGAENLGNAWFDVTAARELAEQLGSLDPEAFASYEREVKPYLLPFDSVVAGNVRDGDVDRATVIIVVK